MTPSTERLVEAKFSKRSEATKQPRAGAAAPGLLRCARNAGRRGWLAMRGAWHEPQEPAAQPSPALPQSVSARLARPRAVGRLRRVGTRRDRGMAATAERARQSVVEGEEEYGRAGARCG